MTHDEHPPAERPHKVIAQRVKELRIKRGLTAAALGERMTEETGIRWDRSVVANLENGRRASVSVEEWLALAYVLDVAPVHLVVPLAEDGWLAVTPEAATTNEHARAWIRGSSTLPGGDARNFFSEVPADEWDQRARRQEDFQRWLEEEGPASYHRVSKSTGEVTRFDRAAGEWVPAEDGE